MATIQEAYKGVLERGEKWRLSHWKDGQHVRSVKGSVCVHEVDGGIVAGYFPSNSEVLSDKWERVPAPPSPRPCYLMVPCEKKKGTHCAENGEIWRNGDEDYRQAVLPLTVEDMLNIYERFQYDSAPIVKRIAKACTIMEATQ